MREWSEQHIKDLGNRSIANFFKYQAAYVARNQMQSGDTPDLSFPVYKYDFDKGTREQTAIAEFLVWKYDVQSKRYTRERLNMGRMISVERLVQLRFLVKTSLIPVLDGFEFGYIPFYSEIGGSKYNGIWPVHNLKEMFKDNKIVKTVTGAELQIEPVPVKEGDPDSVLKITTNSILTEEYFDQVGGDFSELNYIEFTYKTSDI